MAYTSSSGKTYSDSEVEKVGKTTYVKGTSIAVSPSGNSSGTNSVSSSGSGGTKINTPSSSNKSSNGSNSNNSSGSGIGAEGFYADRAKAAGYAYEDRAEAYKDLTPGQYYLHQAYNINKAENGGVYDSAKASVDRQNLIRYLSTQRNPNSDKIWNNYGEVIGITGTGSGGYTDYSWQAANATVNPNRVWNSDERNNPANQRFLTQTPLTSEYLNYDSGEFEKAPEYLQKHQIGFMDYNKINQMAKDYIASHPNTMFDEQGLVDLWMSKYQDLAGVQGYFDKYANEFEYSGSKPTVNPVRTNIEVGQASNGKVDASVGNVASVGATPNAILGTNPNAIGAISGVAGQGVAPITGNGYIDGMQNWIMQGEQAYIEQAQAQLEMERDSKIAALETAYERQVTEGKISIREAQAQFDEQKKEIEKSYYEATQKLGLYANNMGIQNSQQMLGLMQSDVYRKGELTNDAMSDYNKRVSDIRDRINGLMLEKDIAISNANSAYNSGMLGATSTAKLNTSNQMFNLYQTEHQNEVARQQAIENALLQSKLRIEEMVKSGEINAKEAEVAFEREKQLLAIKYGYDVSLTNMSKSGSGGSGGENGGLDDIDMAAARYGVDRSKYSTYNAYVKAVYDAEAAYKRKLNIQAAVDESQIKTSIETINKGLPDKPIQPESPIDSIKDVSSILYPYGLVTIPYKFYKNNQANEQYKKDMDEYSKLEGAYNRAKQFLGGN